MSVKISNVSVACLGTLLIFANESVDDLDPTLRNTGLLNIDLCNLLQLNQDERFIKFSSRIIIDLQLMSNNESVYTIVGFERFDVPCNSLNDAHSIATTCASSNNRSNVYDYSNDTSYHDIPKRRRCCRRSSLNSTNNNDLTNSLDRSYFF